MNGITKGEGSNQDIQELCKIEKKPYWENHFWANGYFVNTVGLDEEMIRRFVKYQEEVEKKEEENSTDFRLF